MEAFLPFAEQAQVWIYEHAAGDGAVESLAVVLAKRPNGLLVALPSGVIPDDELALAQEAQMDDLVGSSLSTEAPALAFSSSGFSPVPEQSLTAIVVDLSVQAVSRLTPVAPDTPMDLVVPFDSCPGLGGGCWDLRAPPILLCRRGPRGAPSQAKASGPSAVPGGSSAAGRRGFALRRAATKASKPKACHDGHPGDSARKPYIDAPYFGEVPGGSVRAAGRNGEADGRRASSTAQPTFGFRDSPETCRSPSLRVVRPSPSHGPCQSAASCSCP